MFAGILLSALYVIIADNPIYCILGLILTFVYAALYMISIGANYLGILYIMIYVGAIAVLFLFIIMLINIRWLNTSFYGFLFIIILALSLSLSFIWLLTHISYIDNSLTINYIAKYLFVYQPSIILLIAYLLIVAMIASLILSIG